MKKIEENEEVMIVEDLKEEFSDSVYEFVESCRNQNIFDSEQITNDFWNENSSLCKKIGVRKYTVKQKVIEYSKMFDDELNSESELTQEMLNSIVSEFVENCKKKHIISTQVITNLFWKENSYWLKNHGICEEIIEDMIKNK